MICALYKPYKFYGSKTQKKVIYFCGNKLKE